MFFQLGFRRAKKAKENELWHCSQTEVIKAGSEEEAVDKQNGQRVQGKGSSLISSIRVRQGEDVREFNNVEKKDCHLESRRLFQSVRNRT